MRTLSRPHRQVLLTLAIALTTIAPTGYVAVTAWRVNRPAHRLEVAAELEQQLGLQVVIEGVRYPRPGVVVLSGAVLRDREPRERTRLVEVARASELRLTRDGRRLALRAEGLAIDADGPRKAMEQVEALLSRAGAGDWDLVSLVAPECRIGLGDGLAYELRDLAGSYRVDAGAPTVEASYRLVTPEGAANRCELVLRRDRDGDRPVTTLTLRTAEGLPPPASVLDPFFASGSWLGPKARVQGDLVLTKVGAGDWGASFSGVLIDVDLARLVGDRVPDHRLDGLARVAVDSAEWGPRPGGPGSGWLAATGELDAGPGHISASLLDALRAEMHFRPAEALDRLAVPAPTGADLPYDRLGLRFAIEPDGEIQLAGALGDAYEPGAVLTEPEELDPLILAPEGAAHMIGLRRTLGPVDAMLIPADFEQPFLDFLPLGAGVRPEPQRAN